MKTRVKTAQTMETTTRMRWRSHARMAKTAVVVSVARMPPRGRRHVQCRPCRHRALRRHRSVRHRMRVTGLVRVWVINAPERVHNEHMRHFVALGRRGGFPVAAPYIRKCMRVSAPPLLVVCTVLAMVECYNRGRASVLVDSAAPHIPIREIAHVVGPSSVARTHGKVLVFMTTSMSSQHMDFLQYCWPIVVPRSVLLQEADVLLVGTLSHGGSLSPATKALHYAYRGSGTNILTPVALPNPGFQEGAMLAMHEGVARGWFAPYEWVVRLNPDVLILDDEWIVQQMGDPNVDALLMRCSMVGTPPTSPNVWPYLTCDP